MDLHPLHTLRRRGVAEEALIVVLLENYMKLYLPLDTDGTEIVLEIMTVIVHRPHGNESIDRNLQHHGARIGGEINHNPIHRHCTPKSR